MGCASARALARRTHAAAAGRRTGCARGGATPNHTSTAAPTARNSMMMKKKSRGSTLKRRPSCGGLRAVRLERLSGRAMYECRAALASSYAGTRTVHARGPSGHARSIAIGAASASIGQKSRLQCKTSWSPSLKMDLTQNGGVEARCTCVVNGYGSVFTCTAQASRLRLTYS